RCRLCPRPPLLLRRRARLRRREARGFRRSPWGRYRRTLRARATRAEKSRGSRAVRACAWKVARRPVGRRTLPILKQYPPTVKPRRRGCVPPRSVPLARGCGSELAAAHEVLVDPTRRAPAVRNCPDDERLPALAVAGREHAGHARHARLVDAHVAALIELETE